MLLLFCPRNNPRKLPKCVWMSYYLNIFHLPIPWIHKSLNVWNQTKNNKMISWSEGTVNYFCYSLCSKKLFTTKPGVHVTNCEARTKTRLRYINMQHNILEILVWFLLQMVYDTTFLVCYIDYVWYSMFWIVTQSCDRQGHLKMTYQ